jgi:hypothetical protein
MRFFNPVHTMKVLEIVRALETDDDTLGAVVEVGKRMGKEVVVIRELASSPAPKTSTKRSSKPEKPRAPP